MQPRRNIRLRSSRSPAINGTTLATTAAWKLFLFSAPMARYGLPVRQQRCRSRLPIVQANGSATVGMFAHGTPPNQASETSRTPANGVHARGWGEQLDASGRLPHFAGTANIRLFMPHVDLDPEKRVVAGGVRIGVAVNALGMARTTRSGRGWLWLALRLGLWLGFSLGALLLWVLATRFLFQGH